MLIKINIPSKKNASFSTPPDLNFKHYVNGKNFGTGPKWFETRGGPLIEVVRKRGYTVYTQAVEISDILCSWGR